MQVIMFFSDRLFYYWQCNLFIYGKIVEDDSYINTEK